jgi:hypothetical protein
MEPETFDLSKHKFSMKTPPEGECRDVRLMEGGKELGTLQVCGIKEGGIEIKKKQ